MAVDGVVREAPLILLIEDDRDIATMYSLKLELDGYGVLVANSGTAGLDAACTRRPDLVLLDMRLPGLSGLEVLRQLRSRTPRECPPVVIVSNYDDPVLREEALNLGALQYFLKSRTTPGDIAARIPGWLSRTRRQ